MNSSIEISQINKHLAFKRKKQYINSKNKTKIVLYNFLSINESNICDKIKTIPYYFNFYRILIDYDFVQIGELSEKVLEKLENVYKNDEKIILFKYDNDDNYVRFNEYLINLKDNASSKAKKFITNITNTTK